MLEDALRKASAFVEQNRERYEHEKDFLISDAAVYKREKVAALVFDRIKTFDTTKHQPPSVEPYRVIWECQHEIEDLNSTQFFIEDYEAAQRRMAELSQQLADAKGAKT
jgi:chromosome segregation ATPase